MFCCILRVIAGQGEDLRLRRGIFAVGKMTSCLTYVRLFVGLASGNYLGLLQSNLMLGGVKFFITFDEMY